MSFIAYYESIDIETVINDGDICFFYVSSRTHDSGVFIHFCIDITWNDDFIFHDDVQVESSYRDDGVVSQRGGILGGI
ncbi:hypothetical protein OKN5_30520 [Bacillus altitudinis]